MLNVTLGSGVLAGAVAAMLVSAPARAAAHPRGVLKLVNRELVAGDSVRVVGEKFAGAAGFTLVLVGVGGRIDLAEVQTDSGGAFTERLRLPDDVPLGAYRLVAVAVDGDEVATLEVAVVAAPAAMRETSPRQRGDSDRPSAEPLELSRARSTVVTGGALVGIALTLVLGAVLLRRPAASG